MKKRISAVLAVMLVSGSVLGTASAASADTLTWDLEVSRDAFEATLGEAPSADHVVGGWVYPPTSASNYWETWTGSFEPMSDCFQLTSTGAVADGQMTGRIDIETTYNATTILCPPGVYTRTVQLKNDTDSVVDSLFITLTLGDLPPDDGGVTPPDDGGVTPPDDGLRDDATPEGEDKSDPRAAGGTQDGKVTETVGDRGPEVKDAEAHSPRLLAETGVELPGPLFLGALLLAFGILLTVRKPAAR